MAVIASLRSSGQSVHHYGNRAVLAGATGVGIIGLYQIIGALADTCVKVVVGNSVIAIDPAAYGGVGTRGTSQLDGTATANRVVAVHRRNRRYRVDGGGDLLGVVAFATCFTVVGFTGKGRGFFQIGNFEGSAFVNKFAVSIVPATAVGVVGRSGCQRDGTSTATGFVAGSRSAGNGSHGNLDSGIVAIAIGNWVNGTDIVYGIVRQVTSSQCFAVSANACGDFNTVGIEPLAIEALGGNGSQSGYAITANDDILSCRSSRYVVDGSHHSGAGTDTLGVAVVRGYIISGRFVDRRSGKAIFGADGLSTFGSGKPLHLVAVLSGSGG